MLLWKSIETQFLGGGGVVAVTRGFYSLAAVFDDTTASWAPVRCSRSISSATPGKSATGCSFAAAADAPHPRPAAAVLRAQVTGPVAPVTREVMPSAARIFVYRVSGREMHSDAGNRGAGGPKLLARRALLATPKVAS